MIATVSGQRQDTTTLYAATLATPLGRAELLGSERGLLTIALPGERRHDLASYATRLVGAAVIVRDDAPLRAALDQLTGYFDGERQQFDLALDLRGTSFQRAVWAALLAIPYGETRTYGVIAAALGRPAAARAVGAANGANPLPPVIPCHRLIGAAGDLRGYGPGLSVKRWLLDFERANR